MVAVSSRPEKVREAGRLGRWCSLLLLAGCGVTPLTNHIKVGEEPFVVAVGEGPDGYTDLFAAPAGSGAFTRLTFNRPEERFPRLSPDGSVVAFLRTNAESPATWSLVFLNLLSNAERTVPLPADAGEPERLGWDSEGKRVVVAAQGYFSAEAPPGAAGLVRVSPAAAAAADSVTRELLGDPPLGMVRECANGGLCIAAATGEVTPLDSAATGAVRWGGDSVGYFLPAGFEIRPLTGGHARRPTWSTLPTRLRQLTYHGEPQVTTSSGVSGIR
jgi:hypothetical protein